MTRNVLYQKLFEKKGKEYAIRQAFEAAGELRGVMRREAKRAEIMEAMAGMEIALEQMKMLLGSCHREKVAKLKKLEALCEKE